MRMSIRLNSCYIGCAWRVFYEKMGIFAAFILAVYGAYFLS